MRKHIVYEKKIEINLMQKLIKKMKSVTGFRNIVYNVNGTCYERNCLISYIKKPFESGPSNTHQNGIQVLEIARLIGEYGYNVDVIDYMSRHVIFNKKYDAIFDICVKNQPVYKNYLKASAKRIVYFTGSESKFANNAEMDRLKACEIRRGVKLQPRRQAPLISKEIEKFDEAIIIGNKYNLATYNEFNLPQTFLVPNTGYNFGNCFNSAERKPTNFLYFGSAGCIHKGLDLLLEIFAEPKFPGTLFVCGNFEKEKDFRSEYEIELYHTENIIPIGFIDIEGEKFKDVCSWCSYTILPSCSEGMAGSIATCMSAGLIPICSEICGYSDNPEIITLKDCSKECIRSTILEAMSKDKNWINEKSNKMLELANEKYSMKNFQAAMRKALSVVL
nr:glycosyltransferase [uncultured Acetatifactor sp.]